MKQVVDHPHVAIAILLNLVMNWISSCLLIYLEFRYSIAHLFVNKMLIETSQKK